MSRFEIAFQPTGATLLAADDKPLLQSALEAGLVLPSSCRNGACRACICRLISGRVVYRIEWPGLSADEKVEGWMLPCCAYPASALVIDAPRLLTPSADR